MSGCCLLRVIEQYKRTFNTELNILQSIIECSCNNMNFYFTKSRQQHLKSYCLGVIVREKAIATIKQNERIFKFVLIVHVSSCRYLMDL